MFSEELQNFLWNIRQPWGVLSYKIRWSQLADIIELKNLKILDFGSGFGTTANYLAKNNEVTAIEPNADMAQNCECENNYTQIVGKFENLRDFEDACFDIIICHNVLEYAPECIEIVKEFSRILKSGGILSVVKHNHYGKIAKAVFYKNNIDEALDLLNGSDSTSKNFGKIKLYNPEDLVEWGNNLKIEKILGIAAFFDGWNPVIEVKDEPEWVDKIFELEKKVCDLEPFKNIAFLNHVLLKKL